MSVAGLPENPRDPELVMPGLFSIEDPPGWSRDWSWSAAQWPEPFASDDLEDTLAWWLQDGAGALELADAERAAEPEAARAVGELRQQGSGT